MQSTDPCTCMVRRSVSLCSCLNGCFYYLLQNFVCPQFFSSYNVTLSGFPSVTAEINCDINEKNCSGIISNIGSGSSQTIFRISALNDVGESEPTVTNGICELI